jgi:hypothetical protein
MTSSALCGVRFDIGRMRTEHEPPSAAWAFDTCTGAPEDLDSGCLQFGCKTFRRRERSPLRVQSDKPVSAAMEDVFGDERMWDVIPSGYDSQGNEVSLTVFLNKSEDCNGRAEKYEKQIRTGDEYAGSSFSWETGETRQTATQLLQDYLAWYRSEVPESAQKPAEREDVSGSTTYDEHIAGPNCIAAASAYSGHQLSYEEMKACTTIQCLGPKMSEYIAPEGWAPSPDDEDFEHTSGYCLSGLGDRPGASEGDAPCYPIRNGADDLWPGEYGGFINGNLPFHPYCFEVYKRASLFHKGKVDIDTLAEKFDRDETEHVSQHPAVSRAADQWWDHIHGDEFLVANPVHIPALRAIIERARRTEPDFSARNCAFEIDATTPERERDLFGRLPEELRDMVLQSLGSKDIANLRQASSSFRRLPISLWYRLVREEMPWLWEAWCDRPYSFWACTTMQQLERHDKALDARLQALLDLPDEQKAAQEQAIAQERIESRKPEPAQHLDRQRTDWHWLHRQIKREWKDIKGLQNRERIWYANAYIVEGPTESSAVLEKLYGYRMAQDERFQ